MDSHEEARTVTDVLAERVRRYRKSEGLRQEDVAARTTQLGHPMSQVTLAKLEAGGTRAERATLVDVLVLAAALDVPPPLLFLPLGEAEAVTIAPGLTAHPHVVLEWLAGEDDLRDSVSWPGQAEAWSRNVHPVRMFRGLRKRQEEAEHAWASATSRDDAGQPAAKAQHQLDRALVALASWLDAMQSAGLATPGMPPEWQARMAELGAGEA